MELTRKQEEGLKIAVERYKNNEPYTVIAGYAGSGKTTLIKFIISALNIDPDDVAYISFTGKAAEVLRRHGNKNAMTAHKLLYYSNKDKDGKFIFRPRPTYEITYKIIVVDEVSMLPKTLWDLLLSHHKYVIACGDPFQLPPVRSKSTDEDNINTVLDNPHIFLDEIMRQAQDSEIIRLSMDIREQKPIDYFHGEQVWIMPQNCASIDIYKWGDQILTATNNTRRTINAKIRQADGRSMNPEKGDKVISLDNHWWRSDKTGENALINGTIGYLGNCEIKNIYYPLYNKDFPKPLTVFNAEFKSEVEDDFGELIMDYKGLTTINDELSLTPRQSWLLNNNKHCKGLGYYVPMHFNYGYAITCHKAQGSQWGKVVVVEENFPWDAEEHARWLYTACTRSIDKLILLR